MYQNITISQSKHYLPQSTQKINSRFYFPETRDWSEWLQSLAKVFHPLIDRNKKSNLFIRRLK